MDSSDFEGVPSSCPADRARAALACFYNQFPSIEPATWFMAAFALFLREGKQRNLSCEHMKDTVSIATGVFFEKIWDEIDELL